MDLEEELATFNKPKLILDREKKPINETEVNFPLVTVVDKHGSCREVHFLWPAFTVNDEYCCIYRVPSRLRRVNPEAYTPETVLIGPIHYSKKADFVELSKTDVRYLDYKKMDQHKKKYLHIIALRYGNQTVEEFRRIIKRDEQDIRAFYAESTDWIKSEDFIEMMLLDSVFILVFFMQVGPRYIDKTGDLLFDAPCLTHTIFEDIILLENQLPYALLENLFEPFCAKFKATSTFRDIILEGFDFQGKIRRETKFQHFTDLCRCVRVETLGYTEEQHIHTKFRGNKTITSFYNANELDSAGVKFVGLEKVKDTSLLIRFEGGILTMPCFTAQEGTEKVLRNIMALEQCHYPYTAFVCNYIKILDFLIDTEQDVDLLVKKGIIENCLGRPESVTEMVNKLCLGMIDCGSHYYDIAESLNNHYKSHLNRSIATLRQVYFKDLWTGTATVAAVVLLILTLIGTVASILQVMQKDNSPTNSLPPPAQKP